MADIKISALPAASALNSIDLVPVVQTGVTRKATASQFQALVTAGSLTVTAVAASRALVDADNGTIIDLTASGLTLTMPAGLVSPFACIVYPNGTTSLATSGGALLNGATTTLVRDAADNVSFSISPRAASDSYKVNGV